MGSIILGYIGETTGFQALFLTAGAALVIALLIYRGDLSRDEAASSVG
jgi:hypothetical protein